MVVRTPSEGELTIYGEGNRFGLAFCSAARARQYLKHGCLGYLTYLVETRYGGRVLVSNVPMVREFPEVFPEDLPKCASREASKVQDRSDPQCGLNCQVVVSPCINRGT